MMKSIYKILYLLITLCIGYISAFSQTNIQVVSRTISRTFNYMPGLIVDIKGEKANIQVKQTKDDVIRIKLQLISKNPSKQSAEADLMYCDYRITESANTLTISNFFNNKENYKEISSNLTAKYEIDVPENIVMKLKNLYGDIKLQGVNTNVNVVADFGQIQLTDIYGNLTIYSNYCDIRGQNINAKLNIQAQKADINLTNINNLLKIIDQYGNVHLEDIYAPVDVDVEMTDIEIVIDDLKKYSIDFVAKDGDIIVPAELSKMITSKQGITYCKIKDGNISLKINSVYNSITLKTK